MKNRAPSPALIVAILALVVALGGTSYAAISIGKNSVGAKQLKKNAVRSAKVADGSLLKRDFKAGQLPAGPQGQQGTPGEQGPKGDTGIAGPTGPAGPTVGSAHGFLDPPAADKTLSTVDKTTITTPTAGSLYVTANLDTSLDSCAAGTDCTMTFGLYVDGNPVPDTKVQAGYGGGSSHGYQNVSTVGIAKGIAAGNHSVELKWIAFKGSFVGGFGQNFANISAVLLGG